MAYDVVIIGGGPGGYVAAIRAAQLGLKVYVVERENLGGICLNWGCIPTKALLKSAEVYRNVKHAGDYGIKVGKVEYDFDAIIKRSRDVSAKLSSGIDMLMKKNKIDVIKGSAKIKGKGKVIIDNKKEISGKHIILSTGARPRSLPGIEIDGQDIWSYKEAMLPKALPKSVLIIGSGAIGIEFADFYNSLGSQVTIVELMDRIMPNEDEEISALARKSFENRGIKIHTGFSVKEIKKDKNTLNVVLGSEKDGTKEINVEKIISAVGVQGNVEDLGLEALGVKIKKSFIEIDGWGYTGVPGIYAIGDVSGPPCLAHKASHEGVICVEKIASDLGKKLPHPIHQMNFSNIPGCTYCHPQVASVGLTEKAAKEQKYDIKVGRFTGAGNGKSVACGDTNSLVKVIFDKKTGELLGAHMLGPEVTEMIQGYVVGKSLEATEASLKTIIWPHPTVSEIMHEAVLDADDEALHG